MYALIAKFYFLSFWNFINILQIFDLLGENYSMNIDTFSHQNFWNSPINQDGVKTNKESVKFASLNRYKNSSKREWLRG